ncbi:MAG TPA: RNA polymerase sigma factor, partial [Urbifossiella sp.]|nr:RNA polymerase sigma factor [Urbifossiella sp.]
MNMAVHRLVEVIQNLGRRPTPDDPDDGKLLGLFIEHRDESAFAALVRRHGPMVWGVCRRIVGHHQDAEDAFQATFLVLARKAAVVRPRRMVANWLYGVANRTALKAKVMAGKRHAREKQMPHLPEAGAGRQESWAGLDRLIDRELATLPDKYRIAVVLCDLEGKKGKDAARQLKIPEGTLASRLRTGRVMLAKRLTRNGITLSGGALAAVISGHAVKAGVPAGLVSSTIQAAARTVSRASAAGAVSANVAALMEGVMKAMVLTKLKPVMAVVLVAGLIALGGVGTHHAVGGPQVQGSDGEGGTPMTRLPSPGARDAVNPNTAAADARDATAKKDALRADKSKATVSYAVADLVVPIPDGDLNSPKNEAAKTKEDWLIRKITRTVSPASWEGSGGTGTIQYSPRDMTLVVSNTARVQAQVRYLLETMRRVQDVQVSAEIRTLSLDAACFLKLQGLLPQLEKGDHTVLNDA